MPDVELSQENREDQMQRTIAKPVRVEGVGLHTGENARLELKPAPPDSGINFVRTDLAGARPIVASVGNILDADRRVRRTSLGDGVVEVHTIEHLMAACSGLGIDNLLVEIDGEELPGLDGSAYPYLELIQRAGIKDLGVPRRVIQVREPVWVEDDDTTIAVFPSDDFRISYTLSYPNPALSAQFFTGVLTPELFEKEIAPSRTFCLAEEAEALQAAGLGQGATYENTVVVDKKGKVLHNRLRYSDECVRHKVLDLIGDLYLLGPFQGHVVAMRSGHALNLKLIQHLRRVLERGRDSGIKATYYEPEAKSLDIQVIKKILPHRYPFLMVDKIVELVSGKRAVGIKNVTVNEEFFNGHFPNRPVFPGVMIMEALAQVCGIIMLNLPENQGKYAYFLGMDNVKFRRVVQPGDTLVLECEVLRIRSKTGFMRTRALVEGRVAAEADLMFALLEGDDTL